MDNPALPGIGRRQRVRRVLILGVLAPTIVLAPLVAFASTLAGSGALAADSFTRTLTGRWGSASTGGEWGRDGPPAAYDVDGARGLIKLGSAGANLSASLSSVRALDVDLSFSVSVDRSPSGSSIWTYGEARRNGTSSYRLKLRLAPGGSVYLGASRVLNAAESPVGTEMPLAGVSHLGGAEIMLHGEVSGSNPATLRVRAWQAGSAEPTGWALTAADSSAALQVPGAVGLRAYSSRSVTNAPMTARFDDFRATDLASPPPSPSPSPSAPPPPPNTTVASDAFGRTVSAGWGPADAGGSWSVRGSQSGYRVDGAVGVMSMAAPGANLASWLPSVARRDVSLAAVVSVDRIPAGSSVWAYLEARRASDTAAYRLKVRIGPDARAYLRISRVTSGVETNMAGEVALGGIVAPGTRLHLRGEAAGANPTALRVRAWFDGQTDPGDWAILATDATASLQASAPVGVRGYLSSGVTNSPLALQFDDFSASDMAGPYDVLVGAGDIGVCGSSADEATATLLDGIAGTVFAAGDTVYPSGSAADYQGCYEPSWGRHRARTRPAVGNHEYGTAGAAGYFGYFGGSAGNAGEGWYAYELGGWRVRVLNSNCSLIGGCGAGSAQLAWLQSDLTAYPTTCSVAIWHHPRFSSGEHGDSAAVDPLWDALVAGGNEIVVAGHDHDYERFAPMDGTGAADPIGGIRSFVVGTGGAGLRGFSAVRANSEVRDASTPGVLQLTLRSDGYDWAFVPVAGRTFSDAASGTCH